MKLFISPGHAPVQRNIGTDSDETAARHPSRRAVIALGAAALASVMAGGGPAAAQTGAIKLVALGDSLTSGFGLPPKDGFTPRLEAALKARGHQVAIVNAGVGGDTATAGADRLDWSIQDGADGVIVELGANDMLRGANPKTTRAALVRILDRLKEKNIPAMLAGMRASPNLGRDYVREFEAIYTDLARERGLLLYPFFLEGVAGDRALNQADGVHPSAKGVDVIVRNITPTVEKFLAQIAARRS